MNAPETRETRETYIYNMSYNMSIRGLLSDEDLYLHVTSIDLSKLDYIPVTKRLGSGVDKLYMNQDKTCFMHLKP